MADQVDSKGNGAASRASRDSVLADLERFSHQELEAARGSHKSHDAEPSQSKDDDHGELQDDGSDDAWAKKRPFNADEDEEAVEEDLEEVVSEGDEALDEDTRKRNRGDEVDDDLEDLDEDEEDELEDEKPSERKDAKDKTKDEDPDLSKRLRAVQKQEKRGREQLQRERQTFEREKQQQVAAAERKLQEEWGPKIAKAQKFEALAERVKYDAVGVLLELGMTEDDLESHAKHAFAMSKAGAAKPENRDAAQHMLRQRKLTDENATLKKRLDDLEKNLETKDQTEAANREATVYANSLLKAVSDKLPLAKNIATKNPAKARSEMAGIAMRLWKRDGERPTPAKVASVYERMRRRDLADAGVDVDAMLKTVKPAAGDDKATGKKAGAAPVKKPAGEAAGEKSKKSREEIRDEIAAELDEQERKRSTRPMAS